MARSNMISLSSYSVVLAMIMASLSLTPVSSLNFTSILNGVTDKTQMAEIHFVGCTLIFDTYRVSDSVKTVMKPGDEKNITLDQFPGVKQVECDVTKYSVSAQRRYNLKIVVWFFDGPSVTRCRFENDGGVHFALQPDLNSFTKDTGMAWGWDAEMFFAPSFFKSSVTSIKNSLKSKRS